MKILNSVRQFARRLSAGSAAALLFGTLALAGLAAAQAAADQNPVVELHTSAGTIGIELFQDSAPITVKNFLEYVDSGFYNGTIFHRVIDGFMIQGGGFTADLAKKDTRGPIKNEAKNGLKNVPGTLAMARTADTHSATSQFFINLGDNNFLNHGVRDYGYAVFGKVVSGMRIVEKIGALKTKRVGTLPALPVETVQIEKIVRR